MKKLLSTMLACLFSIVMSAQSLEDVANTFAAYASKNAKASIINQGPWCPEGVDAYMINMRTDMNIDKIRDCFKKNLAEYTLLRPWSPIEGTLVYTLPETKIRIRIRLREVGYGKYYSIQIISFNSAY